MTPDMTLRDARVLIVDDESGIRDLLTLELSSLGYSVETAADGVQAMEAINFQKFQIVLCDMKMPHVGGIEVLEAVREKHPDTEVIMMTGYATVETAVSAMKRGAYDFIEKPFDIAELLALVDKCLEKLQLRSKAALYESSQALFRSVKIDELLPLIAEVALKVFSADDIVVMLRDETGALLPAVAAGAIDDAQKQARREMADAVSSSPQLGNEPLLIQKPLAYHELLKAVSGLDDISSVLICPFSMDEEPLGVLCVQRTRNAQRFLLSDRRNAAIFTSQIAQAVFNARLYRHLNLNIQELRAANIKIEETQKQLMQSEKLAGIGQLAAGVAHELNNPLSGILGFVQLLIGDSSAMSAQQQADLQTIYLQSKRCQSIVSNLLQFSRRSGMDRAPVDMREVLQSSLELAQHDFLLARILIVKKIPASLPNVLGNYGQLQQVVLNLLNNARHAMADREKRQLVIEAGVMEDRVFVRVADTGHGIPAEIRNKIFDPFFTTKPVGQGTGLGLSICYGIIKDHQGVLRVESEPQVGSTFVIELPIGQQETGAKEKKE